jgi:hypothetical protein
MKQIWSESDKRWQIIEQYPGGTVDFILILCLARRGDLYQSDTQFTQLYTSIVDQLEVTYIYGKLKIYTDLLMVQ